jgi:hypothetical protein
MEKLSFSKQYDYLIIKKRHEVIEYFLFFRVTLFEDPAYHSLIEKIMTNKTSLLKEFSKADTTKNGNCFEIYLLRFFKNSFS